MVLRMGFWGALPWETVIPSAAFQNYVHHLNFLQSELRGRFSFFCVSENRFMNKFALHLWKLSFNAETRAVIQI